MSRPPNRLGERLAGLDASPAPWFSCSGDLGAGKSSLARAMLRGLGVTGPVKSPTYSLVERYSLAKGEAVHMDLYRIAEAAELEFLGLDDLAAQARLWLVEWPERGGSALPRADIEIRLTVSGSGRDAELLGVERQRVKPGWPGSVKPRLPEPLLSQIRGKSAQVTDLQGKSTCILEIPVLQSRHEPDSRPPLRPFSR